MGLPDAVHSIPIAIMPTLPIAWPRKSRDVVQYVVDSTKWDGFAFRDDDVIIATWAKSGTTLTQQIVGQLIFDGAPDVFGMAHSPWIDSR